MDGANGLCDYHNGGSVVVDNDSAVVPMLVIPGVVICVLVIAMIVL